MSNAGRPAKYGQAMKKISILIPRDVLERFEQTVDRLNKIAGYNHYTVSDIMRQALVHWCNRSKSISGSITNIHLREEL